MTRLSLEGIRRDGSLMANDRNLSGPVPLGDQGRQRIQNHYKRVLEEGHEVVEVRCALSYAWVGLRRRTGLGEYTGPGRPAYLVACAWRACRYRYTRCCDGRPEYRL